MVPHYVKRFIITTYLLSTREWGPVQLLECCRKCEQHDNCVSLYITPKTRTCTLLNLDYCTNPVAMNIRKDYYYYERNIKRKTPPPSCYSSCLAETGGDCHNCGKPNCWGPDCTNCLSYCWQPPGNLSGANILWTPDQSNIRIWVCEDGWQRWWRADNTIPINTPADEQLKLRLELVYENGQILSSNFSSVSFLKGQLSVGNYTGGDAGNWWEAPFQSRSLVFNNESNCMPFYSPSSDCVSDNELGFDWTVGNEAYDQLNNITHIQLWITCANCSITGQEEEEI